MILLEALKSCAITILILYLAFFVYKKKHYKCFDPDLMLKDIFIASGVFITNFAALLVFVVAMKIEGNPIVTSGVHVPLVMLFFSIIFKKLYKTIFNESMLAKNSILISCYLITCLFTVILCIFYIQKLDIILFFVAIFLSKFIWFEGASLTSIRIDFMTFLKEKYIVVIMLVCNLFILGLTLTQLYDAKSFSMLVGIDIGIGLTGLIILIEEVLSSESKSNS